MKESRYNVWIERDGCHYVYNGLSGALLQMSGTERTGVRQFTQGATECDCSPDLLRKMVEARMLIRDVFDELDYLGQKYNASRYNTKHFALVVVTSLGCNFDCPYCFEAKHPSIMQPEVEDAILQVLDDQLPHIHSFSVNWFGGEPLVGKRPLLDLSDRFIERCDRNGVSYSATITTNGYLLDAATSSELRNRRVLSAQVSLDGPPEVHDRMRPLSSGRGTFWSIVRNLHHAIEHLDVSVRINIDHENFPYAEQLLQILAGQGFAGKLNVGLGQLIAVNDGAPSPSVSYNHGCFSNQEYARAEQEFQDLAAKYGFSSGRPPMPMGTPCTAVRANELIVGSRGELYKCFESVGNPREIIGDIRHYSELNGRLQRWLKYDPLSDDECRGCIALPVCMGGCAHHAMDPNLYDNRCDTFRHTHREQVLRLTERIGQKQVREPVFIGLEAIGRSEKNR
jgi:uncharacterized protein